MGAWEVALREGASRASTSLVIPTWCREGSRSLRSTSTALTTTKLEKFGRKLRRERYRGRSFCRGRRVRTWQKCEVRLRRCALRRDSLRVSQARLPSRSSPEGRAKAGWEAGIRTPITWSRATCPTVERPPSTRGNFARRNGNERAKAIASNSSQIAVQKNSGRALSRLSRLELNPQMKTGTYRICSF